MPPTVRCAGCGTHSAGAYCPQCGRPLTPAKAAPRDRWAWAVAGALSVTAVGAVLLLVRGGAPAPVVPAMSNPGGEARAAGPIAAPDTLTPRVRFEQLFDRLMRAGAEGDSSTVAALAPTAVAAYARLDRVDADARFHAGLIALQIGNLAGAEALADTIEAGAPGHLFPPILRGAAARLDGDTAGFRRALAEFRQRAATELARADRPEYLEHRQLLTEVQQASEIQ
ncbi:MAG TPA: hypothetical protein VFV65_02700 [Gemmatimonadales bacterium]|nr:hypothetical protein [Gemmatimonadales bacterium]